MVADGVDDASAEVVPTVGGNAEGAEGPVAEVEPDAGHGDDAVFGVDDGIRRAVDGFCKPTPTSATAPLGSAT